MLRKEKPVPFAWRAALFVGLAFLASAPTAPANNRELPAPRLVINEVMASNGTFIADPQGDFDDWIEIYNPGDTAVDLGGMYLTDDPADPTRWEIPSGSPATTLGAKGYLIVWADEDIGATGFHASFRLGAAGDEVHLFDTDGETLIDSLAFGLQSPDISFGRYPDAGETLRFFGEPTPGQQNNEGYLGEVAPLRFSRERGFCDAAFDLTILTATEDARIVYTIDGKVPNDDTYRFWPGRTYTGPLHIARTVCLRAMAVKPGWKPTRIYTHTYIFDARPEIRSLPAISLVGDEGKTFYEPDGVMAIVGGNYSGGVWSASGTNSYNNVLERGLERPVSAEWIEPEGNKGFQISCGLRVHGSNWMRPRYRRQDGYWTGDGKFSLRLYFRGEYGQNQLNYRLFPESEVEQFATIVLRGGHNDRTNPFIKDELLRRLHKDMGQRACMGTFANLFINGEYKGYFNPTEHVKEEACRRWFDSDQPWDVMTMNGIRDGNAQSWNDMLNYARTHNLANPMYYAELSRKLDVVAFIDYLIIRLWPNDWDWPQNNWSAVAERSEAGQWKFFVWDAEGTFVANQLQVDRFGELNSQGNANGVLYRALKASPDFRLLFADRLYKHFYHGGALTKENIEPRFYELRDVLRSVIPNMNTYIISGWTPTRDDVFINACIRERMYTFAGPGFAVNGTAQHGGYASQDDLLSLIAPPGRTTVYYTLDGTDPSRFAAPPQLEVTTLVPKDADKRVLVPAAPQVGNWRGGQPFDDSGWMLSTGAPGGIGYERNSGYESHITTDLREQMYGINGSCYIRIPFTFASNKDSVESMTLRLQYDDGFVAFLNGIEIARRNFAGEPVWDSVASASHGDTEAIVFESIDVSSHIDALQRGNNILAIHGLNVSLTSSDILIGAELVAGEEISPETPAGATVYSEPIRLTGSTHVKARVRDGSTWSALSEATFAVGPVAETLRISEIMYHPAEPNAEYIELTNIGAETIDLNLVRFTDGIDFVFSAVSLSPGECTLVVKDLVAFETKYGAGLPVAGVYAGSLNSAGERVELQDAAGSTIHSFRYQDDWYDVTDGPDFSLTVKDPAATDPNAWGDQSAWRPSAAVGGSPGFDDSGEIPELGAVVVNELLANSAGGVPDWIELHNTTDQAVNIGGWFLSDDADDLSKYEIAEGTIAPPKGYLVFTEDRHFGNTTDAGCHTPFALSRHGETVYLHSGSDGVPTGYNDRAKFGPSEPGVTFGRHQISTGASDFVPTSEPTPGGANGYPQVGPIVINEIMYHPGSDGPADAEYVELRNVSDTEVTLYDAVKGAPWRFAETGADPGVEFLFPVDEPVTLAPGRYLVLVKDRLLFEVQYGIPALAEVFEWGPGRLSNGGESIQLSKPGDLDDAAVRGWIGVDRVAFSDGAHPEAFPAGSDPWPPEADGLGSSLTRIFTDRYGNDPNNWRATVPSPGAARRRPSG